MATYKMTDVSRHAGASATFWMAEMVAEPPFNTLTPESRTAFGQLLRIFNSNEPGLLHRP